MPTRKTIIPDGADDASEPLAPPVDDRLLARIVGRIVRRLPDACVVLFGSRAYGRPSGDSDLDLLIITGEGDNPYPIAGELYGLLRPRTIPLDLVILSPAEMRRRIQGFDPFLEEATKRGRLLHGRLPE